MNLRATCSMPYPDRESRAIPANRRLQPIDEVPPRKLKAAGLFALALLAGWTWAAPVRLHGAALMEEPFNYPAGTSLAANPPWSGGGASLRVASGNLTLTNLGATVPAGNRLRISGSDGATARRNFSATPVVSAEGVAVYCSALVNCTLSSTNRQFLACLLPAGATAANAPDDAVDLYMTGLTNGAGCRLTIRSEGSDSATARAVLTTNTTHLIVLKYTFGSNDFASLYLDPVPGAPEPVASARTESDDGDGGDDGGGVSDDPPNLQVLLFQSPDTADDGGIDFDSVRVGTNWADVTPRILHVFTTGPQDQAVCSGSPAVFSVTANGTPPFTYQWRTNGIPVAGATNSSYELPNPGAADALAAYDVVVHDSLGAVTSRVARLTVSTTPAVILAEPDNQIVMPGATDVVFTVTAAGDAPLTYQWRTNGVAVTGATNASYLFNLGASTSAAPAINFDVVVANPCGMATSSPPALLVYPHVFYDAADAGPGFFGGENLVLTNRGGLVLQSWSSDSLATSVTGWSGVGVMQEQPLNDGTGRSLYAINVTPAVSPTYYIFGSSVASPYLTPVPVVAVSLDHSGNYALKSSDVAIAPNGMLAVPGGHVLAERLLPSGVELTSTGTPGSNYVLQSSPSLQPPQWAPAQTNTADTNGVIRFQETNPVSAVRFYRLVTP